MQCQGVERGQIERRVAQAAKRFGLDDLLHRDPAALSAGQQLLVAIAAVAVARPPVLVLDEPPPPWMPPPPACCWRRCANCAPMAQR